MNADVSVSLLGTLRLTDAEINTTAAWLASSAGLPPLDGQVRVAVSVAELVDNWPTALVGTITVEGLASSLIGVGGQGYLGNVIAEFDNPQVAASGVIRAGIRDGGGPLRMNGSLDLTPPSNYALNVKVAPGAEASNALLQNLKFLGSPDAQGAYEFALNGSL
jgi:hypothetical protein